MPSSLSGVANKVSPSTALISDIERDGTVIAVEVASEAITDEDWKGVPNGTVYNVAPDYGLRFLPLKLNGGANE